MHHHIALHRRALQGCVGRCGELRARSPHCPPSPPRGATSPARSCGTRSTGVCSRVRPDGLRRVASRTADATRITASGRRWGVPTQYEEFASAWSATPRAVNSRLPSSSMLLTTVACAGEPRLQPDRLLGHEEALLQGLVGLKEGLAQARGFPTEILPRPDISKRSMNQQTRLELLRLCAHMWWAHTHHLCIP